MKTEEAVVREYEFWLAYVQRFAAAYQAGRRRETPSPEFSSASRNRSSQPGPRIMICAPHPDDELLTGALSLRLLKGGAAVLDLALTLGSDPARQQERKKELAAACKTMGFEWQLAEEPLGFSGLSQSVEGSSEWQRQTGVLQDHFKQKRPEAVILPHDLDGHPSHRVAHRLVVQSLQKYALEQACEVLLIETEYWQSVADPDLLLGLGAADVAWLLTALVQHRGEVQRQPYHLWQPPRLMDSVRRGSELVSGFGQRAVDFLFGELYRISKIASDGRLQRATAKAVIPPGEKVDLTRLRAFVQN